MLRNTTSVRADAKIWEPVCSSGLQSGGQDSTLLGETFGGGYFQLIKLVLE